MDKSSPAHSMAIRNCRFRRDARFDRFLRSKKSSISTFVEEHMTSGDFKVQRTSRRRSRLPWSRKDLLDGTFCLFSRILSPPFSAWRAVLWRGAQLYSLQIHRTVFVIPGTSHVRERAQESASFSPDAQLYKRNACRYPLHPLIMTIISKGRVY